MNFKALALGAIFAASTAMPASFAHPLPIGHGVVHTNPHTTASAVYCADEDFFSRFVHNSHGTFYSGGTDGDEGYIGFTIDGSNIINAAFTTVGSGDYDPTAYFFYTTNGSNFDFGGYLNSVVARNGAIRWSFNRNNYSLPSGAQVVEIVFEDEGEGDAFTETGTDASANGIGVVPQLGSFSDCSVLD